MKKNKYRFKGIQQDASDFLDLYVQLNGIKGQIYRFETVLKQMDDFEKKHPREIEVIDLKQQVNEFANEINSA